MCLQSTSAKKKKERKKEMNLIRQFKQTKTPVFSFLFFIFESLLLSASLIKLLAHSKPLPPMLSRCTPSQLFETPMDYSPPGSSVHGIFPGKNTGMDCHAPLQRIFPTQGLSLHPLRLLHSRLLLYHLATGEAQKTTLPKPQ